MGSIEDMRTLEAAIARIVPDAASQPIGGELDARFVDDPATHEIVRAGLFLLRARGFDHLSPEAQDGVLHDLEGNPSVALLIRLCVEGYITSPAGLAAVGFRVTA